MEVTREIELARERLKTWRALTEPESQLEDWFANEVELEAAWRARGVPVGQRRGARGSRRVRRGGRANRAPVRGRRGTSSCASSRSIERDPGAGA